MTNYGLKFNERPRTPQDLERLTWKTPEQIKAEATLRFIERGRPSTKNSDPIDPIPGAPERWPWERRKPGHVHAEPIPECRWLSELLGEIPTPWYRRLWRWIDPRKQFRDWDRDDYHCRSCGEVVPPMLYRCACGVFRGMR